jgi:carboxyl-terminal processing protease
VRNRKNAGWRANRMSFCYLLRIIYYALVMPRLNIVLIVLAITAYGLCSAVTMQDRIIIHSLHHIQKHSLFEPSAETLFEGAMSGLLDSVGDHYSMYIPPSELQGYEDELNNRFTGIGINHYSWGGENEPVLVFYPILQSHAFEAGIQSGDQILEINGKKIGKDTPLNTLIPQTPDAEVRLTIIPFGKTEPKKITIETESIQYDSVEGGFIQNESRIFHLESNPQIGYIRITSFSETTVSEVEKALKQIAADKNVKGLILDLRDNPGGYVLVSIQIARMFLKATPTQDIIVTTRYKTGSKEEYRLFEGEQICDLPMTVLINDESASASEILAAALQDYQRAKIVGTRSFGKGIVQQFQELPFHLGLVQLTGADYLRPNGKNIHRKGDAKETDVWGITPDIEVKVSQLEQIASNFWQEYCRNSVGTNRNVFCDLVRKKIIDSILKTEKESEKEKENGESTPLESLPGSAPLYDPQLEKAVEVLTPMTVSVDSR